MLLQKQKKEEGDANVTTVLFDDQIDIIHDRFPIGVVEPLTDKDYYVRGCTALLDAVGSTVKKVENIQERLPEEMKAESVIEQPVALKKAPHDYTCVTKRGLVNIRKIFNPVF